MIVLLARVPLNVFLAIDGKSNIHAVSRRANATYSHVTTLVGKFCDECLVMKVRTKHDVIPHLTNRGMCVKELLESIINEVR